MKAKRFFLPRPALLAGLAISALPLQSGLAEEYAFPHDPNESAKIAVQETEANAYRVPSYWRRSPRLAQTPPESHRANASAGRSDNYPFVTPDGPSASDENAPYEMTSDEDDAPRQAASAPSYRAVAATVRAPGAEAAHARKAPAKKTAQSAVVTPKKTLPFVNPTPEETPPTTPKATIAAAPEKKQDKPAHTAQMADAPAKTAPITVAPVAEEEISLPETSSAGEKTEPAEATNAEKTAVSSVADRREALRERLRHMQMENAVGATSEPKKTAAAAAGGVNADKEEILISSFEEKTSDEDAEPERANPPVDPDIYYRVDPHVVAGKSFTVTALSGAAENPAALLRSPEKSDFSYLSPHRPEQRSIKGVAAMKACLNADAKAVSIKTPCASLNAPEGKPFLWKWEATALKQGAQKMSIQLFRIEDGESVPAGERAAGLRVFSADYMDWNEEGGDVRARIVAYLTDFETIIVTGVIIAAMMALWLFKPRRRKSRLYRRDDF
ncbi:MAG: hypothetical protein ABW189_09025 [Rickettsiales bacterium]